MSNLKLISWNINGIRAIAKKGFYDWMDSEQPDILGLQETKISADQLTPDILERKGYKSYFSHAEKRGYSGVGIYTRVEPISVKEGFGVQRFDCEGRTLVADFGDFVMANIYFPNGAQNPERLQYKLDFYEAFYKWANKVVKEGKKLTVCGDFNTAHQAIDLARPKENEKTSGFLPIERAWMDKFIKAGYADTFRMYNQEPHNYSWWHMRTAARERNVGWRIDYFFTSKNLTDNVVNAGILSNVHGSDHCPVTLEIKT
jgi:exodeoxyribonuclease-3